MDESVPTERPRPEVTALTEPYWDSAGAHRLSIQRCHTCSTFVHPPRPRCTRCAGGDLGFEPVSGRGVVETYSIVHKSFAPGFAGREPYVLAWVELAEQPGLRVMANLVQTPLSRIAVGMPVLVTFESSEEFGAVPQFRGEGVEIA